MTVPVRSVIWVGSYPKSGNTWAHEVLRTAGKFWGFPQGSMDVYDMILTGRRPEVCKPVARQLAPHPCSVLKTHAPYSRGGRLHTFDDMDLQTSGLIYIYRNPLDLLLSYINFTRIEYAAKSDDQGYIAELFHVTLGMRDPVDSARWAKTTLDEIPTENLDHALDVFSDRGLSLPTCLPEVSWAEHVRGWLQAKSEFPAVVLKYEDCVADRGRFAAMAEFFDFGSGDIAKAIASSDERSRQAASAGTEAQKIFYNKMTSYYYGEYFSDAAIRRFCERHGGTLSELGYDRIVVAAQ